MTKRILVGLVVIIALAFGGWYYIKGISPADETQSQIPVEEEATFVAPVSTNTTTGVVAGMSSDEIRLTEKDGKEVRVALSKDTQFLRTVAEPFPVGSVIHVINSKSQGKPVAIFTTEPVISVDEGQDIELISGEFVSIQGKELKISAGGSVKTFTFEDAVSLPVSAKLENVSGVKAGDEVTVEYTETSEEKVAVSVIIK